MKKYRAHIVLTCLLFFLFFLELRFGSASYSWSEFLQAASNRNSIVWLHRFPAALTAALAGASLSMSGWLLQTLFRNPLAGPSILGITSGSSLMVAIILLAGIEIHGAIGSLGVVGAALIGALLVLILILIVSLRFKQLTTVLIFGLMVSYLLGAFQSILIDTAGKSELKSYVNWGLASFGGLRSGQLISLFTVLTIGIVTVRRMHLKLDFWLLGDSYARSLGVDLKLFRIVVLAVCGLLAAVVTAYCGPVAFLGLAMPHGVKLFYKKPKHLEFLAVLLLAGACGGVFCEFISRMPWSDTRLPLNAVTSLLGAPVVIWLMIKARKDQS